MPRPAPYTFQTWNASQIKEFYDKYRNWEAYIRDTYKRVVSDDNYENATKHTRNLKEMIDALPYEEKRRVMEHYRLNILGLDKILDEYGVENLTGSERARRFAIDPTQLSGKGRHPLAVLYNRMTIRPDDTTGRFIFGSNIPTRGVMRETISDLKHKSPIRPNANILVFDTETSGLLNEAGIRQISAVNVTTKVGEDGRIVFDVGKEAWFDKYFKTARMQWGAIATGEKTPTRMSGWLESMKPHENFIPGEGEDFANTMRPFLEQIRDATHIAGQNIGFDLDQIFIGLSKTRAYHRNEGGFKDLLDEARDSLSQRGKVKDTLEIARSALPDIDLARELKFAGEERPHSLENLMLQTNILDLIKEHEFGGDEAELHKVMGIGSRAGFMHSAEVDTQLEAYLLKYLFQTNPDGTPMIKKSILADRAARAHILRSYAPTPISKIADIEHIDRALFDAMAGEKDAIKVMGANGQEMRWTEKPSTDELYHLLTKGDEEGNIPFAKFGITPLEQDIWSSRRYVPADVPVADDMLAFSMGSWREYTKSQIQGKGFLNRMQTLFKKGIRPSEAKFAAFQKRIAKSGIPFAGISETERMLTEAMSMAGARESAVKTAIGSFAEGSVAEMAEDLGISRFAMQEQARLTGKNVSMPLELLQAAEKQGVLQLENKEGLHMVGLSAFKGRHGPGVNLMSEISEGQATALGGWMKSLGLEGVVGDTGKKLSEFIDPRFSVEDIAHALPTLGAKHGLVIGYLDQEGGRIGHAVLESIHQGLTADRGAIRFRGALLGDTSNKVLRVGAFVMDRFMGEGSKYTYKQYAGDLGIAETRLKSLMKMAGSAKHSDRAAFREASNAVVHGRGSLAYNALKVGSAISERLPLVAGGAAAIGAAYYFTRRHKRQAEFADTMDRQHTEGAGAYAAYRKEMGLPPAPAVRRISLDPMSTSYTVGNLDKNKINHQMMGSQKYQGLFAGVVI